MNKVKEEHFSITISFDLVFQHVIYVAINYVYEEN